MVDILVKLFLLQATVAEIETDEERERAFISGVLAALEFFEDAIEEVMEA